jgi:tetratricopeptide (TPR) repeat protein
MDNQTWFKLGIKLFVNNHIDESFDSFKNSLDSTFIINFASLTWMGHIKDLQNEREEALNYYHKALDQYPGFPVQHDQWNILINESWIKEKIKIPFKGINQL